MFGLGLMEILFIFVVLILLSKPEDLPKTLRKIGKTYGQIQRLFIVFTDEINRVAGFEDEKKIFEKPKNIKKQK